MYQKKSVLVISTIIVLLTTLLPISSLSDGYIQAIEPESIIDQSQENSSYEQTIHNNIMVAQSFIPSMTPLTAIDIRINKPRKTELPLVVSVKKSLDEPAIASRAIPAQDIPFFSHWIKIDLTDTDVVIGEPYYIIVSTSSPSEAPYRWYYDYSKIYDPYPDGTLYRSFDFGNSWESIESELDFVDAAFRTYSYRSQAMLSCEGFLNWTDVESGQDNLSGSFSIENTGTPFSKLNWKIISWPYWGKWEFSSKNGSNLKPEDGPLLITMNVEAPHSTFPTKYNGRIIIVNEDDHNQTCIIQAHLATPKVRRTNNGQFFFRDLLLNWILSIEGKLPGLQMLKQHYHFNYLIQARN
jgi:hypothetical protein